MKILFTLRKPPVATATVHCPHVYTVQVLHVYSREGVVS